MPDIQKRTGHTLPYLRNLNLNGREHGQSKGLHKDIVLLYFQNHGNLFLYKICKELFIIIIE